MIYGSYATLLVGMYSFNREDWQHIAPQLLLEHAMAIDEAIEDLKRHKASGPRMNTAVKRFYGIGAPKASLRVIGEDFASPVQAAQVGQLRSRAEGLMCRNYKLRPVAQYLHDTGFANEWLKITLQLPTQKQMQALQRAALIEDEWEKEQVLQFISVYSVGFSLRTAHCLSSGEIKNVAELRQTSKAELLRLPSFGRKSLQEVEALLAELNLSLDAR
jgi:hypothetical protein